MKLILSGLSPATELATLSTRMSRFGPVRSIHPIREGDPQRPWLIVDLNLPLGAANAVARRIDGMYFNGRFLHANVALPIGPDQLRPSALSSCGHSRSVSAPIPSPQRLATDLDRL